MYMSTAESINNNNTLRTQILNDLISKSLSLIELSKKYNIEITELYSWLKSVEININQILSLPSGVFPPVDDEEWLNMTEKERVEFFDHLKAGLKYKTKTFTIDDLDEMIEKRKQKK